MVSLKINAVKYKQSVYTTELFSVAISIVFNYSKSL